MWENYNKHFESWSEVVVAEVVAVEVSVVGEDPILDLSEWYNKNISNIVLSPSQREEVERRKKLILDSDLTLEGVAERFSVVSILQEEEIKKKDDEITNLKNQLEQKKIIVNWLLSKVRLLWFTDDSINKEEDEFKTLSVESSSVLTDSILSKADRTIKKLHFNITKKESAIEEYVLGEISLYPEEEMVLKNRFNEIKKLKTSDYDLYISNILLFKNDLEIKKKKIKDFEKYRKHIGKMIEKYPDERNYVNSEIKKIINSNNRTYYMNVFIDLVKYFKLKDEEEVEKEKWKAEKVTREESKKEGISDPWWIRSFWENTKKRTGFFS
jgi:hypothetical protein